MICEEVMELMQRSLDGDLDRAETSLMKEHIQACPECAAMYARLTLLSDNLAQLPRVAPSFSIVDSILPQLEKIELAPAASQPVPSDLGDDEPAARSPRTSRPAARRVYRRLAGAIAAGIAAGLLIVAWPNLKSSQSDQDRSFNAAAVSDSGSPSASASPSAAASASELQKKETISESTSNPSSGAADNSSSQAGDAQPTASAEPRTFALKSIVPDSAMDTNEKQEPQEQTNAGESGVQSNEGLAPEAPTASLAAPDSSEQSGAAGEPAAGPTATISNALTFGPQNVWDSPDGKYKAMLEENRLKVYQASDNTLLFESDEHLDSILTDVVWDDDSGVLHYVWTDAYGKSVKLEWTAATGQESAAASDAGEGSE